MNSTNSPSTKPIYRGTQVVWYIVGLVEVLLAFRFVLLILAANTVAGFTDFIYTITQPLAYPFLAVFRISNIQGNIFEWTTILAMFVYWLIGYGITKLLLMGKTVSTPEAAMKLEEQEQ
jgi:SMC interacting uncharacterized protein involved in chromosome segregation